MWHPPHRRQSSMSLAPMGVRCQDWLSQCPADLEPPLLRVTAFYRVQSPQKVSPHPIHFPTSSLRIAGLQLVNLPETKGKRLYQRVFPNFHISSCVTTRPFLLPPYPLQIKEHCPKQKAFPRAFPLLSRFIDRSAGWRSLG